MKNIIDKWPSAAVLARDISVPDDLVRKWGQRQSIPAKHWDKLISAAAKRSIPLTHAELSRAAASK